MTAKILNMLKITNLTRNLPCGPWAPWGPTHPIKIKIMWVSVSQKLHLTIPVLEIIQGNAYKHNPKFT